MSALVAHLTDAWTRTVNIWGRGRGRSPPLTALRPTMARPGGYPCSASRDRAGRSCALQDPDALLRGPNLRAPSAAQRPGAGVRVLGSTMQTAGDSVWSTGNPRRPGPPLGSHRDPGAYPRRFRRPLLAALAYGRLRIGELLALRWREVNLASGCSCGSQKATCSRPRRVAPTTATTSAAVCSCAPCSARMDGSRRVAVASRCRSGSRPCVAAHIRFLAGRRGCGHCVRDGATRSHGPSDDAWALRQGAPVQAAAPTCQARRPAVRMGTNGHWKDDRRLESRHEEKGLTAEPAPRRRGSLRVELGGLEPPTSWVRSRRSPTEL